MWCNGYRARLANNFKRFRVTLSVPYIRFCVKAIQMLLNNNKTVSISQSLVINYIISVLGVKCH